MNTVVDSTLLQAATLEAAIAAACGRVAPTWPLDAFIAVNPWWGWRGVPMAEAARELGRLAGTRLTLPRDAFRTLLKAGAFGTGDLQAAIAQAGAPVRTEDLLQRLHAGGDDGAPRRLPLMTDLADAARDLDHAMAWGDFVTHHISQQCAAYFDARQSRWPAERQCGLYASWLQFARADPGAALLMGDAGVRARIRALPATADEALQQALRALGFTQLDPAAVEAYCTALLASIGGWAAWAAYLAWQARLEGGEDAHLRELLAIRLAWEGVLQPTARPPQGWARQWLPPAAAAAPQPAGHADEWLLQSALELAWQRPLAADLQHAMALPLAAAPAEVLAVFCIDVRSEPLRRALEAAGGARVRTAGFAGFFGLPIAYRALGSEAARAQLPGLLAPRQMAEEAHDDLSLGQALASRRKRQGAWRQAWNEFRGGAASTFTFVEACGLSAAGSLLRSALGQPQGETGEAALRPRLAADPRLAPAEVLAQRCTLAAGVLRAMGLASPRQDWPPLVLLAGHGSHSANNPFAAGLDCGACGGQTGEVNARVLARLLNDAAIREGLTAQGIPIPPGTLFVAGLHCTTTDAVDLFDTDLLPASAAPRIAQLKQWLHAAGQRTRAERAPALGLRADAPAAELQAAIGQRSRDWAQPRPEWGLANNAGFIAAPRARTRHLDLKGRVFLHDYDWRGDAGFAVLELIMTAPMVVANWINLQYHASVVDPVRYGSGNKVLHNVVGGRIGVFEGNGGDLRIGLPWQSVHDDERFVHTPQRLSVFIEAPVDAMDTVIAKHAVVRELVEHGWLHLFCMDPDSGQVLRRARGGWQAEAGA